MVKAKILFVLIVGGAILFYQPFLKGLILKVGNARVYAQDLAFISLFFYFLIFNNRITKLLHLKSAKYFLLFFLWGIFAIIRGYPEYGFSAIGESRCYVLILIYYFSILAICRKKEDVMYVLKGLSFFIIIMLVSRFIYFFFLGGNVGKMGIWAYRFIFGVSTLLISFLWIYVFQIYINVKRKYFDFILLVIFSLVLILVQIRSVWLSVIGGIFSAYVLRKKISIKSTLLIASSIFLLLALSPVISKFIGVDTSYQLEKSIKFMSNPKADPTGSWRLIGWQAELQKSLKNPILGQGFGKYSIWFDGDKWIQNAVHNGYIMLFSKAGVIGILLLFFGIYYWFKEMHEYIKKENNYNLILLGYFFPSALVMHLIFLLFYGFTMFFWIIIGMGSVLCRISLNNASSDKKLERKCV